MSNNEKTFILGLGHQKCGTTWVYKYLSESPLFHEGFTKEYHIWDGVDVPLLRRNKVSTFRRLLDFRKNSVLAKRYAMQRDSDSYFDYFDSLYSGKTPIAADITPSYSGLKAKRLLDIKTKFAERQVNVKAVVFVRDPLSRIKSAVRFNLDRRNYNEGIKNGETDFAKALGQYYTTEHCVLRTRYQSIISEAKKVFPENQLYVGFFENMFTPDEIKRLSSFLGVEPNTEYAQVKVNKTRNTVEETEIDGEVKAFYAATYEYCSDNYPETRELWE